MIQECFADSKFAERCPSGRRSAPGERVYPLGIVGSNPTLSAIFILISFPLHL